MPPAVQAPSEAKVEPKKY